MFKILKYSFFDLLRSRWSLVYFLFYCITTSVLFYLSGDADKVVVSLMNIILILAPLIGTLFGVIHHYNSREFIELLLAQPLHRRSIFAGMLSGITLALTASLFFGLLVPVIFFGKLVVSSLWSFLTLLLTGVFLTVIFTSLGFAIALMYEHRLKGFGVAILIWLLFAFVYDGLFLLGLLLFESYPLENFAIAMALLNPIDLSRTLIMLQLDISALLGYTGAVFSAFFGTTKGIIVSMSALLLWCAAPMVFIFRACLYKDF